MTQRSRLRSYLIHRALWVHRGISAPGRWRRRRMVTAARENRSPFIAQIPAIESSLFVDPNTFFAQVYVEGVYEPGLVRYFKRILKPGMVCIDIGANVGFFTLLMAQRVLPSGTVTAFEAAPSTCDLLLRNVHLNRFSNVTVESLAVSDHCGTIDFHVGPPGFDVYSSSGTITHSSASSQHFHTISIPSITLDDYLQKRDNPRVDIIKLDVEGCEFLAIKGMERTLESNPNLLLIIEFAEQTTRGFGYHPNEMANWLFEKGWKLFVIKYSGKLDAVEPTGMEWTDQMVVASKADLCQ
jgi:FkbM family methyltransferase